MMWHGSLLTGWSSYVIGNCFSATERLSATDFTYFGRCCVPICVFALIKVSCSIYASRRVSVSQQCLTVQQLQEAALKWEEICMEECRQCWNSLSTHQLLETQSFIQMFAGPDRGHHLFLQWEENWSRVSTISPPNQIERAFHGIISSATFASDFPLREYIQLCYVGHKLLRLPDDLIWLERLSVVVRYALFRRLALMEEARFVKSKVSSVLHHRHSANQGQYFAAWHEYGRPSWVVPKYSTSINSSTLSYLLFPLSYFPLECIFNHVAMDDWLQDPADILVVLWRRDCRARIIGKSKWRVFKSNSIESSISEVGKRSEAWTSTVDYWFIRYTQHLFDVQQKLPKDHANELIQRYLGGHMLNCVTSTCSSNPRSTHQSKTVISHLDRYLALQLCSKLVVSTLRVLFPRVSLYSLSGDAGLIFYCSHNRSSGNDSVGSGDAYILALVRQLFLSSATLLVEVAVTSYLDELRRKLEDEVSSRLCSNILFSLICGDAAFIDRKVETMATEMWTNQVKESPRSVLQRGNRAGSALLQLFDRRLEKVCKVLSVCTVMAYRRESPLVAWIPLTLCQLDASGVAEWVSNTTGFSQSASLRSYLSCIEGKSHPQQAPLGLRLLAEVLAEKYEKKARQRRNLSWPFLSLLTCSSIWEFNWFPKECQGKLLLAQVTQLEGLYERVSNYRYEISDPLLRGICRSLQRNVRCILFSCLHPAVSEIELHLHTRVGEKNISPQLWRCTTQGAEYFHHKNNFVPSIPNGAVEEELDPSERELLENASVFQYLPTRTDFGTLFSKPYRFVLRHLGLEMVFACAALDAPSTSMTNLLYEELEDMFSSSRYNPFAFLVSQLLSVTESLTIATMVCARRKDGRLCMKSLPRDCILSSVRNVQNYLSELRSVMNTECIENSNVAALHVAHELLDIPCTISDRSSLTSSPVIQSRRKAWMEYLRASPHPRHQRLLFDDHYRIVDGLYLQDGISLHHVNFSYPQLRHHHSTSNGLCVKMTLQSVSATFPATGMTGIIGPSGSGKSTLSLLLKRMYDPIPAICVEWHRKGTDSQNSPASEEYWSDEVIEEAIHLQFVENSLPPPPDVGGEDSAAASRVSLEHRSFIKWDDIPAACLSTSYLRSWIHQLDQSPIVLQSDNFIRNLSCQAFQPMLEELNYAVDMCRCRDFIDRSPAGLNGIVGGLSGGEYQRLALARVVVACLCQARQLSASDAVGRHGSIPASYAALLLDEPTSRCDLHTEMLIQGSLERLLSLSEQSNYQDSGSSGHLHQIPPLLAISIAHRLSTLRSARHIVVIENGKVTAQGMPSVVFVESAFAKEQARLQSVITEAEGD